MARIGIALNGKGAIEVGPVPGRRQSALYEVVDGEVRVLAFVKEEDTERLAWWLCTLLKTSTLEYPDARATESEEPKDGE